MSYNEPDEEGGVDKIVRMCQMSGRGLKIV